MDRHPIGRPTFGGEFKTVIIPVSDFERALTFYSDCGLPLHFRDGDRWATFEPAAVSISLAGPGEFFLLKTVAIGFKVGDIDVVAQQLVSAGARLLQPPTKGAHQMSCLLRDADGNAITLYSSLAPTE